MKPSEVLKAAKQLISTPDKWIQRAWSEDAEGRRFHKQEGPSVKWCAVGAIRHIMAGDINVTRAYDFLKRSAKIDPARYNDSATHDDVMALYDTAIKCAQVYGQ